MKTLLTIRKLSSAGRVLEKRAGYSRSFIHNFEELLYASHAQLAFAAPRAVTTPFGSSRALDSDVSFDSSVFISHHFLRGNFLVASPSGDGGILPFAPQGVSATLNAPSLHFLPGYLVGIVIGSDNTLENAGQLKLVTQIPHGQRTIFAPAAAIESRLAGDTTDTPSLYGVIAAGFLTTPTRLMTLTAVKVVGKRTGNPGIDCTMKIYDCRGSQTGDTASTAAPAVGTQLSSDVFDGNAWAVGNATHTIALGTPIVLYPGCYYYFEFAAPSGSGANFLTLRYNNALYSPLGAYVGRNNTAVTTLSTVPLFANGLLYEIDGTAPDEVEYGACEVSGLTVVADAKFTIRRLFTNKCGNALLIQECGIYAVGIAAGNFGTTFLGNTYPLAIARDVIAPHIDLLDTEVLEVTYTPTITV